MLSVKKILNCFPRIVKTVVFHPIVTLKICLRSLYFFLDLMADELRHLYYRYPQIRYKKVMNFKISKYIFNLPDLPSFLFQWKEIMQDEIYRFKTDSSHPVIIDIGANVGTSLLFFSKNYPNAEISAYEADPVIFGYLVENTKRNHLENVKLFNLAVYDSESEMTFNSEGADGGRISPNANGIKVSCVDIRSILTSFPRIDMLKIDIEGAENKVIPAAAQYLKNIKNIFIEFHQKRDENDSLPEILTVLRDAGFSYKIFNAGEQHDHAFTQKYAHDTFSMQLEIFATNMN